MIESGDLAPRIPYGKWAYAHNFLGNVSVCVTAEWMIVYIVLKWSNALKYINISLFANNRYLIKCTHYQK